MARALPVELWYIGEDFFTVQIIHGRTTGRVHFEMKNAVSKNMIGLSVGAAVIYFLISVVNHYNFRTYALDLGLYTNALYDYIHFQFNDSSVFKVAEENLLADHFDLYLVLLAPLSLVFKSYTLIIVQLIAIVAGGMGVYRYFCLSDFTRSMGVCAAAYFYLFFGVFAAVAFDYHSSVIAACLVPWFFFFVRSGRLVRAAVILALILISKENISLWATFICAGMATGYRKDLRVATFLMISSLGCLGYFLVITSMVMPALSSKGIYPHFHYSALGQNYTQCVAHLFSHPIDSLRMLFVNHTGHIHGDYVKLELWILLIVSGLPILFFRPAYLLMLVPVFFQKLFHDHYGMWGTGGHYCVEFSPVMAIGIFTTLSVIRGKTTRLILVSLVIVGTTASTIRTMDRTVLFTDKPRIRFYQLQHYKREYDVTAVHNMLGQIPPDAVVSAQAPFLPHLSYRDRVYQFPIIRDAEYIVFSIYEGTYPMERADFDFMTDELLQSDQWRMVERGEGLVILTREQDDGSGAIVH